MFDVGFSELLVIGVLALMVVGPERLPKLARQAGMWVSRARRMVSDVKSDIDREINRADLAGDLNDVKNVIHDTKSQIDSATSGVADTINKQSAALKDDVESLTTPETSGTDVAATDSAASSDTVADNTSKGGSDDTKSSAT